MIAWARRFGFGQPTGVDLSHESAGELPDPKASDDPKVSDDPKKRPWAASDTMSLAVGQGTLRVTPLQVARLVAAVANGGRLVTPHLVDRIRRRDKPDIVPERPETPTVALSDDTLAAVRRGMVDAVATPGGTAYATVFHATVSIAGKTGTAQTGKNLADHAWFAGYVPVEDPKYALVVVLEHSGNGGEAAGPVAQHLIEALSSRL